MTNYNEYDDEYQVHMQISELRMKLTKQVFGERNIHNLSMNELSDTNVKLLKEIYKTIKNRLIRKGHSPRLVHKCMTEVLGKKGYTESYTNFHRNTNQSNVVHMISDMRTLRHYNDCVKGTDYVEVLYDTFIFGAAQSPITTAQIMLAVKALGLSVSRTSVNRIKQKAND